MKRWLGAMALVAVTLVAATSGCGTRTGDTFDLWQIASMDCVPAPAEGSTMFGGSLLLHVGKRPVTITEVVLVDPHDLSLAGTLLVEIDLDGGEVVVGMGHLADVDNYDYMPVGWDQRVDAVGATVQPGEEWNLVVLVDSHSEGTAWAASTRFVYEDSRGRRYQQETLTTMIVTHEDCTKALEEASRHFGEEDDG